MERQQQIQQLLAQGKTEDAIAVVKQWLSQEPKIANYNAVANLLKPYGMSSLRQVKIALLSSFTHRILRPFLEVEAVLRGLAFEPYFGDYDQWRQELMISGSGLDAFAPEIIVLMVHLEDLAPQLANLFFSLTPDQIRAEVSRSVDEIAQAIHLYRQRSNTPIVVHNFVGPALTISRSFDWSLEAGMRRAVFDLNHLLAAELGTIPGVAILDVDDVAARFGKNHWRDERQHHTTHCPINLRAMPDLAAEIVFAVRSLLLPRLKCIVVDLDNTLWGGIIGEDGLSGIKLGPQYPGSAYVSFQQFLLQMKSLGVLLAINSRNNPADAIEVFEKHPYCVLKIVDFAAYRINWQDKDINIRELAQEINVGLDSMMFVDDNPAECERVRSAAPEVVVVHLSGSPLDFSKLVLNSGVFFAHVLTEEDRRRGELYTLQKKVSEARASATSFEEFARSLAMELTIAPVTPADIPRVAQLTQKTNQFNLTTRRYQETEISQMLEAASRKLYLLKLSDRFGDYGIIGVIILDTESEAWTVDTFLLSCRVIGRKIEEAILAFMINLASMSGAQRLVGQYRLTPKNKIVEDLYAKAGFDMLQTRDSSIHWVLDLPQDRAYPSIMIVNIQQQDSEGDLS